MPLLEGPLNFKLKSFLPTIKFINPIGWHLTAATTVGKIYTGAGGFEAAQGAFRKDGEIILERIWCLCVPGSFEICAKIAFKGACKQAKPILLEPIMKLEVVTP